MKQTVITIFGGSGFLGRHTVQKLAETGAAINIVSRDPEKAARIKPSGPVGQIALTYGSIHDEGSIKKAVRNADIVINTVGILYQTAQQKFSTVHAQGPERLAKAARDAGVKHFVHVSALGVDKSTKSLYARSKMNGEKAVMAAFPDATIVRPSILFGQEDNFFNRFASMARFMPFLPLIGGGKTKFQPVYVTDVAKAITAIIQHPDAQGKIFELGGPQVYSYRELMEYILQVTGHKRMLLSIPFQLASLIGSVLQFLPDPLLTYDQVELLKVDNIVSSKANSLKELGITPQALESIVPEYLARFR